MTTALNNVLDRAEGYRNADFGKNNDKVKDTPLVEYPEIRKIINKWIESLFPENFTTPESFATIKNFSEIIDRSTDEVDQRIKSAVINFHGLTWKSLKENQKPSEEDLAAKQKLFQDISSLFEAAQDTDTKQEFMQLSLHPRLLTKCSEDFLERVALNLSDMGDIDYSVNKVLDQNSEMHDKDDTIAAAMRNWSGVIPLEIVTKEGMQKLKVGISYPYFAAWIYIRDARDARDSLNEAAKYLTSVVLKATNEKREVTDLEQKDLKVLFESLHKHLENIQSSHALYLPKNEAAKELEAAKVALLTYQSESADRKKELTENHQKTVSDHAEAVEVQKKYGSLQKKMEKTIPKCALAIETAEKKLNETVEADKKQAAELTTTVVEAQAKFDKLVAEASQAPVSEDKASEVKLETLDMVIKMKENMPLACICMKDCISFSQARVDREVAMPSKSWSFWSK